MKLLEGIPYALSIMLLKPLPLEQDQRSQKLTLREKKAKSNRKVPNLTSVQH